MKIEESSYKHLSEDALELIKSDFIVDYWSYSSVTTFSRHEKAFEMQYIFRYRTKKTASSVAGNAYHAALDAYFSALQKGEVLSLPELEKIAFDYIDSIAPHQWQLQKTNPTIEACIESANKIALSALNNFYVEKEIYEEEIEEVMAVEISAEEYIIVNGVEIPLPCKSKIDLVFRNHDGKVVLCDHKSKKVFTGEEELSMIMGIQMMVYVKVFESAYGIPIDECWYVENKVTANKDGSPQLQAHKIALTEDVRRLYEALLYEPLKRMIEAVNNPDYVYMINHNDSLVSLAEIYDFWCKTMISEVEDFDIESSKKDLVSRRLKKIRDASVGTVNPQIIKTFKENASKFIQYDLSNLNMTQSEKIEHVLRSFKTLVRVAYVFDGYSSDTYLLEVSAGVKIASIYGKRLDIANALNVSNVRINSELTVYEGRSYVSIEVTKKREKILEFTLDDLQGFKLPIGRDNLNELIYWDLANQSTPHMLICGATGSGKSVCIRAIISYAQHAGVDDIIILDPKFEFKSLASEKVKVLNEIEDIEAEMLNLVVEMNQRVRDGASDYKLIIFDELADAITAARKGKALGTDKSLEENLRILAQKGRSVGFRMVSATQRASTKIITGDTKVNYPVQVCFKVPKEVDSKVVIDEAGAESLAGGGDGLIKSPEYPSLRRFQAYYIPSN